VSSNLKPPAPISSDKLGSEHMGVSYKRVMEYSDAEDSSALISPYRLPISHISLSKAIVSKVTYMRILGLTMVGRPMGFTSAYQTRRLLRSIKISPKVKNKKEQPRGEGLCRRAGWVRMHNSWAKDNTSLGYFTIKFLDFYVF